MGRAYLPTQEVRTIGIGTVSKVPSFLLMSINGISYSNGFRINYNSGYRLFSPSFFDNGGNNVTIGITCVSVAYGEDLPPVSLTNIEVSVLE
jgi:hypothetical protein